MNDHPPAPVPASDLPPGLPRLTTPTWEVELLISGVAVFAMLQLPGLLDDALFAMRPRLEASWHQPLKIMHMYFKATTVILAFTFAIHLFLRANWIALVGMHSIYPDGVRWDKLRMGPVQRELEQARAGDASLVIDRADNRATTVFATGVAMATILLSITLLIGLLFAIAVAALALAGIRMDVADVFLVCVFAVVVPTAFATSVDQRFGARMPHGSLRRRLLAGIFRAFSGLGFSRGGNVVGLLSSHSGELRTSLLVMAIFLPVMIGLLIGTRAMESPERLGEYGAFPQLDEVGGRSLRDEHYDRRRDLSRDPAVPYIDDTVVIGPFLRLTVPFIPGKDDRAMQQRCGGLDPGTPVARLDCLQSIHAATLDGRPVADFRYEAGTDPRTDRPALVAMVDVRAIAPGRHELRIAKLEPREDDDPYWVIPFWR